MVKKRLIDLSPLFGLAMVGVCAVFLLSGETTRAQSSIVPFTTIQEAINNTTEGGTVIIPAGRYTESLTVIKDITLTGVSFYSTTIVAPAGQRVIIVGEDKTLRLENLALTGGTAAGDVGGSISTVGRKLQIVNCWIYSNSASYGGAIFQDSVTATMEIYGSRIEFNHANNSGGALYPGTGSNLQY